MSFSQGHALLIGVGAYAKMPHWNVPTTANDARDVAAVLRDPRYCDYPEGQVTVLTDADASRNRALSALDTLAQVSADSTIFLFYAGHGHYGDDGTYYLTTHDAELTSTRKVKTGTAIDHAELIAKLQALKARRVLLIFNACHSGELSPAMLDAGEEPFTGENIPSQTANAMLATGQGRVIITACREGQYSYIGSGDRTIFGRALTDGLRGQGLSSQRGYISVFDLYTQLYYNVGDEVQKLPAALRQRYSETQEPELTVLKGIGPFAVALFRGAAAGEFSAPALSAEGLAVREITPARSQAALRQLQPLIGRLHEQNIGGNANVGAAVAGDVQGNISVTTQRDTINTSGGDNIHTGNISGSSGVAIGRGAQSTVRNVSTGGGDYAEGDIDKRHINTSGGSYIEGDQFNMSGDFRGAILNIKSTLENVSQSIAASPRGDQATKDELKRLIDQLSAELQRIPQGKQDDAEAVATTAKQVVELATAERPNKTMVQITADGLKRAAENIKEALPTVLPIVAQIATLVLTFVV